ncbi:hypothetical protein G5B35_17715 [Parapusillimonas sp. SGNA-6]|uniref:hypothetical protein n=1 Tax=Parapedobacter sp. SGR-10 TaxID=2710879 RepID=UPI0013D5C5DE|nr:hypothetical protein [Parapedobacter sp. SGR-10]NGF57144.1 hypothetical protein [Parapedobacter sp. SGR-10]NGM89141.1 hypothetical protein [Parapusillimonas sp. SGNA-6]
MDKTTQDTAGLGDLEKTLIINELMQIPFAHRDEHWVDRFLQAIAGANLKLGQQEVALAADGYPYLLLETVAPDENFKAFVIDKQLPMILQEGFGIIINAHHAKPDWVFSYGDIVNLELHDEFYTDDSIFSRRQGDETLSSDEEVLIGQPSDSILPKYLRVQLRDFLVQSGVKNPKTMLMARNHKDEQQVSQDLVFNFTPEQFGNRNAFNEIMQTIAWFLPRHYSFFCIDEMAVENGFEPI